MKKLTLKFGKEKINDQDTFFSTVSLLKAAINNTPQQGGINVTEMSNRIRLLELLDKHPECDVPDGKFEERHLFINKTIELEDADFEKLKQLFSEVKWKIVSKFIVQLSEELNLK
jgi:hypothetical protein